MMSEPLTTSHTAAQSRPFPWFCSRCRRKEVWRTLIPYQCQRTYKGRPITVVVADLAVPRCGHCGELDFDYEAEAQINQAYQAQTAALSNLEVSNGPTLASNPADPADRSSAQ